MTVDIDPELRRAARFLPRGGVGPRLLPVIRRLEPVLLKVRPAQPAEVVPVGPVSVRVHRPPAGTASAEHPGPALLWIHGGGYIMGSPNQDDAFCRLVARRFGVTVAAVNYRKAPEHAFPVPLDDCHAGLVWLAQQPGVDAARIAVGGASAGGGLAAALILLAYERGEVRPCFQLLSYPMLDDRTTLRAGIDEASFRLWNQKANRFGWRSYLGQEPGLAGVSGLAAAARYENLTGLPPAWIGVGTCDLFHDEVLAYAERLAGAGVPCQLHVTEGGFHAFDVVAPKAQVSRDYQAAQLAALAVGLGVEVQPA